MKKVLIFLMLLFFAVSIFAQNYSLQFDGVDDYVQISNSFFNGGETNQFTMECWVKINEFNQTKGGIWGKASFWKEANLSYDENDVTAFYAYPNSYNAISVADTPSDLRWHHIAWVMDANDKKLFLDGVLVAEETTPHDIISWDVFSDSHRFGCRIHSNIPNYLNGFIDSYKLSSNVQYTENFEPDIEFSIDSHTEALYNFNEGSGNTLYDLSGNDNHCSIHGATWSTDVPSIGLSTDFSADVTSGYIPLVVNFTDTSIGEPIIWEWDFENDGIYDSFIQNPTHTYNSVGTYSVKLKISDSTYVDSLVKENYITVDYCPPASPDSVQVNIIHPDAIISWTAVDTTECGSAITPDGYIIQFSENEEDYFFLNYTTELSYLHTFVAQYSSQMFYQVIAVNDYNRKQIEYLEGLNSSRKKNKWSFVKQNLEKRK